VSYENALSLCGINSIRASSTLQSQVFMLVPKLSMHISSTSFEFLHQISFLYVVVKKQSYYTNGVLKQTVRGRGGGEFLGLQHNQAKTYNVTLLCPHPGGSIKR